MQKKYRKYVTHEHFTLYMHDARYMWEWKCFGILKFSIRESHQNRIQYVMLWYAWFLVRIITLYNGIFSWILFNVCHYICMPFTVNWTLSIELFVSIEFHIMVYEQHVPCHFDVLMYIFNLLMHLHHNCLCYVKMIIVSMGTVSSLLDFEKWSTSFQTNLSMLMILTDTWMICLNNL